MDEGSADALSGRCLCGAVSIELEQRHRAVEACHCDMCRRWSGGPLFTLRGVTDEALSVTGEEHVAVYRSSEWAERAFCARCGSNLWYRFIPEGKRSLLAGLFDLPQAYTVTEQIFVDERPSWAELAGQSLEKTGEQVLAEAKAAGLDFG